MWVGALRVKIVSSFPEEGRKKNHLTRYLWPNLGRWVFLSLNFVWKKADGGSGRNWQAVLPSALP